MKTKLLQLLRMKLRQLKYCDICKAELKTINDKLQANKIVKIELRPDFNHHGVCSHYHIMEIKPTIG